ERLLRRHELGDGRLPAPCRHGRRKDDPVALGGLRFEALDESLMLRALPGVFAAGEMLDWEAPTGGYLLTACFASGLVAAEGVLDWLQTKASAPA
ncbi:MAG TPA: NAD(P)/FAD-dependent oxidoreductase, partial [Luteimonas sp.]|nr:NAD(P)/FAD-dependent oxidoreductase [Luteimonas sp.]